MSLCVTGAGPVLALAVSAFTLRWEHSVERTEWQEDWRVTPRGLVLERARARGSGAGLDPGPGAVLEGGWWVWHPEGPPLPALVLAASGATRAGWTLCAAGRCRELGAAPGAPLVLAPCPAGGLSP